MSFSTGFKDGFGYYKAFSDMEQDKLLTGARLKTEELRQQAYQSDITESEETRDVRIEGIKAQSDFQVARAEKTRAETDEFIALADQRKESANLLLESNRATLEKNNILLEEAKMNLQNKTQQDAIEKIINVSNILTDPDIDTDVAASFMEDALIDLRETIDFTKFQEDSYWQGWEAISPKIEAGDFESIAKENPDALSNIFKENLRVFNNKNFVTKDGRQGVIQNVTLAGGDDGFVALDQSANMMVKGRYEVLFQGATEPEIFETYMPDNAKNLKTISEDTEGVDAKSISIADIVDKTAAEKDFAYMLVNNPKMLETFTKAAKGATNFQGNPEQIKDKAKLYFDIKDNAQARLGTIFKTAEDFQAEVFGGESEFLESLYSNLPYDISSKHIERTTDPYDDDDFVFSYKSGSSAGLIQDDFIKTYINPEKISSQIENTYARFNSFSQKNPGQKALYDFGGLAMIDFDKSTSYVDATLEDTFGSVRYTDYKNEAAVLFSKAYPGKELKDASDAEYLAFMESFINRRLKLGR